MEFKNQQAIYLQIADYICEKILQKELQANDKVPSVREMAMVVEVNPNTIVRSYAYLEEQGIIYKQRGIGYFVADDAYAKTIALKKNLFLVQDLPALFKTMQLLEINFDELKSMLAKFK